MLDTFLASNNGKVAMNDEYLRANLSWMPAQIGLLIVEGKYGYSTQVGCIVCAKHRCDSK